MESGTEPAIYESGSLIAGRYEVIRAVGSGGMGWVVHVVDRSLNNKSVALKLLYPHLVKDSVSFARFQNEVLVTRELSHPNIVKIFDLGVTDNGQYFISLEYVHGRSLKELIVASEGRGLPFPEAVRIMHEIAAGIGHAHRNRIIHRDLKPDNILISNVGEVKIVDFGIARSLWQDQGLTQTGGAVGTPYYMSPEQIRGESLDARCDIYSLGIIAYEIVSGRRPFEDEHFYGLAQKHLEAPLPPIPARDPEIPQWFHDAVHKLTEKERGDRYQTVDEFADLLVDVVPTGRVKFRLRRSARPRPRPSEEGKRPQILPALTLHSIGWLTILFVGWSIVLAILWHNDTWQAFVGSRVIRVERMLGSRQHWLEWITNVRISDDLRADLDAAISNSDKWRMKMVLNGGLNPNYLDAQGMTPLYQTINTGFAAGCEHLLAAGADPNFANANGETPLMLAVTRGAPRVVGQLLKKGADPRIAGSRGETALHIAAQQKSAVVMSQLIAGKDVSILSAVDNRGNTPLHLAASNDTNAVDILLAAGMTPDQVNLQNEDGRTAFMNAAELGLLHTVQVLLEHGANPALRNRDGAVALELAPSDKRTTFERLLSASEKRPD